MPQPFIGPGQACRPQAGRYAAYGAASVDAAGGGATGGLGEVGGFGGFGGARRVAICVSVSPVARWKAATTACMRSASAATVLLAVKLVIALRAARRPRVQTSATRTVGGPPSA